MATIGISPRHQDASVNARAWGFFSTASLPRGPRYMGLPSAGSQSRIEFKANRRPRSARGF